MSDKADSLLKEAMEILQWDENGTPSVDVAVRISQYLEAKKNQPVREDVAYQMRKRTVREGSEWSPWYGVSKETYDAHLPNVGKANFAGVIREVRTLSVSSVNGERV